jgi:hypothetical protein
MVDFELLGIERVSPFPFAPEEARVFALDQLHPAALSAVTEGVAMKVPLA